jgi:hypothetical protein
MANIIRILVVCTIRDGGTGIVSCDCITGFSERIDPFYAFTETMRLLRSVPLCEVR